MNYVLKGQISISLRDLAVTIILLICTSGVYVSAITADEPGIISLGSSVRRDQKWLSSDGMFAMGIFSLKTGANYLGIWYANITSPMRTRIIWVANRDNPASNSASLDFRLDGNLVLLDQGKQIWSSNTSRLNVSFAQLDKTGNFLLISRHNSSSNGAVAVWESFDTPCDTLIPGMKIGLGSKLTAWKDSNDPARGRYSVIVDNDYVVRLYWNSTVAYWTSGEFDGGSSTYSNVPSLKRVNKRYNQIKLVLSSGKLMLLWNSTELYERIVVSHRGYMELQQYIVDDNINIWQQLWFAPDDPCKVHKACGSYGVCTPQQDRVMECACATGFRVSDSKSWDAEDTSKGCVRLLPLNCTANGGTNDKFLQLGDVKINDGGSPSSATGGKSDGWCSRKCISDCSCVAYSYQRNGSCFTYSDASSFDLRNSSASVAAAKDIHIRFSARQRLAAVSPSLAPAPGVAMTHSHKSHTIVKIVLLLVLPLLALASGCLSWNWCRKRRSVLMSGLPNYDLIAETPHRFTYDELRIVTKNFSHKVGSGGFGDVYKGFLSDNRTLAVKRLKKSKQIEKEFQTEVLIIGAIHHQNLVRLLGFCAEGSHRLLVYEYLENSSLDRFLFKSGKKKTLSWGRRFSIAVGTARGLAYIHEECRDRIMHFDVKPANILLDHDFAAKLSDFGTAKLVDRDMSRVITRTRGTRGYMAPEWLAKLPITSKFSFLASF